MTKILIAPLFTCMLVGCAIPELQLPEMPELPKGMEGLFKSNDRSAYTGADTVGAVDPDNMIGTWQVQNVNATTFEKEFDMQIVFNEDKSLTAYMKAEFGEPVGKFAYDIIGTWSVEGDYVTVTPTSATETTGNTLAGSGTELFDEDGWIGNVYESSANYMVLFDEEDGVAQSYTRVR